jgi:hypothetical protein
MAIKTRVAFAIFCLTNIDNVCIHKKKMVFFGTIQQIVPYNLW